MFQFDVRAGDLAGHLDMHQLVENEHNPEGRRGKADHAIGRLVTYLIPPMEALGNLVEDFW